MLQIDADAISAAIEADFEGLLWLRQCRVGCGFGADGERTMDMWGISCKKPHLHIAVEIKISRDDFRRDLRSPLKQRRARMLGNQFYFAAPNGLLMADDLPIWAGLIEVLVSEVVGRNIANIVVPAPYFDSSPPTWSFVASLVRRLKKD